MILPFEKIEFTLKILQFRTLILGPKLNQPSNRSIHNRGSQAFNDAEYATLSHLIRTLGNVNKFHNVSIVKYFID